MLVSGFNGKRVRATGVGRVFVLTLGSLCFYNGLQSQTSQNGGLAPQEPPRRVADATINWTLALTDYFWRHRFDQFGRYL
jgi:hypothetical protein